MPASTTSGPNLDTIAQIALTVGDLERSVAFYRDALGMPLLFQAPPTTQRTLLLLLRLTGEGSCRSPLPG